MTNPHRCMRIRYWGLNGHWRLVIGHLRPCLLIALAAALAVSGCASTGNDASGPRVELDITPGLGIRALADTLAAKQVINSRPLFLFYAWYYNYGRRIKPNRYHLQQGTGERRALKLLSGEEPALVMVTIPEGYTMNQVAATLEAQGICRADSFLVACADTSLLRWEFAVFAPSAEGYLFPETYEFQTGSPPGEVVRRMLRQFRRVMSELKPQATTKMTDDEYVTLASIVEREAKMPDEYPRIAGVFANRLRRNLPLQSCATVEYLLPERKGRLSEEDTKLESPYNTYLHEGLSPGAICNPGRRALEAALYPEKHDFLFFVARGDGSHIFSRTSSEHAAACTLVRGN